MGKSVSVPEIVVPVNHSLTFFGDVHLTAGVAVNRTFRSMSMHQPTTSHRHMSNNKKRIRKRKSSSVSLSQKSIVYDNYFANMNGDIVLNGYHSDGRHRQSLPDIEHFAILLYYNIKHCTIPQLQQLWGQLIALRNWSKRENVSLPTIYIRFAQGNEPQNSENLFNMICDDKLNEKVMDLRELQRIFKVYYDKVCPKTISHPAILKKSEREMDMLSEGIGRKETKDGNWFDLVFANGLTPMTPFGGEYQGQKEDLTIFGALRPKIAIVATAFAVAVSFGFRISRANNLGCSH